MQVVITSPLVRTLQTAARVFGNQRGLGVTPLMAAVREQHVIVQEAMVMPPNVSFIACDLARERMSKLMPAE